jgi:Uma2 family endonuclease
VLENWRKPRISYDMSAALAPPRPRSRQGPRPEPLENGDRLTAPEFMRRYATMPEVKKAELIEGIVYMPSPVRVDVHGQPDNLIQTWLGTYAFETPGVEATANSTLKLDVDNVLQPDAALRILEEYGGASHLDEKGYLAGPPELIVEIAASSSSIDLHDKLQAYRRNGVKEYLIWRTTEQGFDWFVLAEGNYQAQRPDAKGLCHSVTFPGLILNVPALLGRNGAAVLASLNAGLKSKAHQSFVAELVSGKGRKPLKR